MLKDLCPRIDTEGFDSSIGKWNCLFKLGTFQILTGDVVRAEVALSESYSVAQGEYLQQEPIYRAFSLTYLAVARLHVERWEDALKMFEVANDLFMDMHYYEVGGRYLGYLRAVHFEVVINQAQLESWHGNTRGAIEIIQSYIRFCDENKGIAEPGRARAEKTVAVLRSIATTLDADGVVAAMGGASADSLGDSARAILILLRLRALDDEDAHAQAADLLGELFALKGLSQQVLLAAMAETAAIIAHSSDEGGVGESLAQLSQLSADQERLLGASHPDTIRTKTLLAHVLVDEGRYSEAISNYVESIEVVRGAFGANSPILFDLYHEYAEVALSSGRLEMAAVAAAHAVDLGRRMLLSNPFVAHYQSQIMVRRRLWSSLSVLISACLRASDDPSKVCNAAASAALEVQGLQTRGLRAVYKGLRAKPVIWNEMVGGRKRLSSMVHADREVDFVRIGELLLRERRLWDEVQFVDVRVPSYDSLGAQVALSLPSNSALILYFKLDVHASHMGSERGGGRYVACLLTPPDLIRWFELGSAASLETAFDGYTASVQRRQPYEKDSRAVYDGIIRPLRPYLRDVRTIFVVVDGAVARLPLSALMDESGELLMEKYAVQYLPDAHDLLTVATEEAGVSDGDVVLIGDMKAPDLSGAAAELEFIRSRLPHASVSSSFDVVRRMASPRIFHVASHSAFRAVPSTVMAWTGGGGDGYFASQMLSSVLEIRGADVLSAYEMSLLDFSRTELVVLAACGSGRGKVEPGEHMLGFRAAMAIAGAKTQVVSLWDVSDLHTAELMKHFYENLFRGMSRTEALRQAQLDLASQGDTRHPYHWAGFVMSGAWQPLFEPSRVE